MCDASISAQTSIRQEGIDEERAVIRHARTIIRALQVEVIVRACQDVERSSRRDFENRRDGEISQEATAKAVRTAPRRRRGEDGAKDEAVALVKERVGSLR